MDDTLLLIVVGSTAVFIGVVACKMLWLPRKTRDTAQIRGEPEEP